MKMLGLPPVLLACLLLASCSDDGKSGPSEGPADTGSAKTPDGGTTMLDGAFGFDSSYPGYVYDAWVPDPNDDPYAGYLQTDAGCSDALDCPSGYCGMLPGADAGLCYELSQCAVVNKHCVRDEDCCPLPAGSDPSQRLFCIGDYCATIAL